MAGYVMATLPDRSGCWGLINGKEGNRNIHDPRIKVEYKLPEIVERPESAFNAGAPYYSKVRKLKGGTFTAFPEYKEDPWDAKIEAARTRAAEIRAKKFTVGSKPFRPTAGDTAYRLSKDSKTAFTPMASRTIIFHKAGMKR